MLSDLSSRFFGHWSMRLRMRLRIEPRRPADHIMGCQKSKVATPAETTGLPAKNQNSLKNQRTATRPLDPWESIRILIENTQGIARCIILY